MKKHTVYLYYKCGVWYLLPCITLTIKEPIYNKKVTTFSLHFLRFCWSVEFITFKED